MNAPILPTALLIGCLTALTACQSTSVGDPNSNPTNRLAVKNRVNKNSNAYSKLSASQKKSVSGGGVSKGMSKEAVRIAWGRPVKVEKVGPGKEQWIYYRKEPVTFDSFPAYHPYSFLGSRRLEDPNGPRQSSIRSTQRIDRSATFQNGHLIAWTEARH